MWRKDNFSRYRVKCADYEHRHKKPIHQKARGTPFQEVGVLATQLMNLGYEVYSGDRLCRNCFPHYKLVVSAATSVVEPPQPSTSAGDPAYVPIDEATASINLSIEALDEDISPLKLPSNVRLDRRQKYAKRKQEQLFTGAKKNIQAIYEVSSPEESSSGSDCETCDQWEDNVQNAISAAATKPEKIRLLTLIPQKITKETVLTKFTGVTTFMVDKARKLVKEGGVWCQPDPYVGHKGSDEDIRRARDYYLEDHLDCSRQSPNKKDMVGVLECGKRIKKVKRYMTRTIQETYRMFKDSYPDILVGHSKFYSLRPKWVTYHPERNVCVCVYCANMQLCCNALKNVLR